MSTDNTVLLVVAVCCFLWAVVILAKSRPHRHSWINPEPPLRQHRCRTCDQQIFYAKTTDGKIIVLDSSVPMYIPVQNENGITRVCEISAYTNHSLLCHPSPTVPFHVNGRTTHE